MKKTLALIAIVAAMNSYAQGTWAPYASVLRLAVGDPHDAFAWQSVLEPHILANVGVARSAVHDRGTAKKNCPGYVFF